MVAPFFMGEKHSWGKFTGRKPVEYAANQNKKLSFTVKAKIKTCLDQNVRNVRSQKLACDMLKMKTGEKKRKPIRRRTTKGDKCKCSRCAQIVKRCLISKSHSTLEAIIPVSEEVSVEIVCAINRS